MECYCKRSAITDDKIKIMNCIKLNNYVNLDTPNATHGVQSVKATYHSGRMLKLQAVHRNKTAEFFKYHAVLP